MLETKEQCFFFANYLYSKLRNIKMTQEKKRKPFKGHRTKTQQTSHHNELFGVACESRLRKTHGGGVSILYSGHELTETAWEPGARRL